MIKILVVEDDNKLNAIVCEYLVQNGYHAKGCLLAEDAYDEIYANKYDLIISDVMMPEIDGFEFAQTIRSFNKNVPILFMTALDDITSKTKGYIAGIDDYMVKPIDLNELLLRIHALVRRANIMAEKRITIGNLTLDSEAVSAYIDEKEISLSPREFQIIFKLLSYPNKTFSREQLFSEFWTADSDTNLRAIDVYITKLRDKFASCTGFRIATVYGLGYKVVLL